MYYLLSYEEFLNESLKYSQGIKQYQVEGTVKHIKEQLLSLFRLDEESIAFVGSAGKRGEKVLSYNINLGLNHKKLLENNKLNNEELYEFVEKQFKRVGVDCEIDENKRQVIVDWPVEGDDKKGKVELRLKLTENLKWLQFARHSPKEGEESKYHSKYREALFEAIANTIKMDIVEYFDTKDSVKEYETYTLDVEDGLHIVNKSFVGKHGILKKAEVLEESKRLATDDPNKFTHILFGNQYKPEDIMTLESCMKIVNDSSYVHKKKRKRIFEKFKQNLVRLRLEIPEKIFK